MKFRTEYQPQKADFTLSPEKPVVLAGSCFSQNIASKMKDHLWDAVNSFGTLYNPSSIYHAIEMMLDEEQGVKRFVDSLFYADGLWNSYMFDSSFSSKDKEDCVKEFQIRQEEFLSKIVSGKVLIITFGTSICYYLREDDVPVGNCHKLPSRLFDRKRLSIQEISILWNSLIKKLKARIPDIKIIFTVSPVRHLKDGFTGNARSKAILLLAAEGMCNSNESCVYFPSFEILNDDLRDYRFYASDLVHPSEEAIDYIWEIFKDVFLEEEGKLYLAEGLKKVKSANHRPKSGALGKPLK